MNKTKSQLKTNKEKPYFKEWLASKVDPEIIELNVKYLKSRTALEYLLGNALEKLGEGQKTPHSQQYVTTPVEKLLAKYAHVEDGGWWASGIDILDKFKEAEWGCFKPDKPRLSSEDKKPIKYEHPPQTPTAIFALDVPQTVWQNISYHFECPIGKETHFWEWVINNPEVPVVITEGAKKAGALLTAGYAAIALPGINNGLVKEEGYDDKGKPYTSYQLGDHLKAFAQEDRKIVFCFDSDKRLKTQQNVKAAITRTGELYKKEGCYVAVMTWDYELGKGIDDVLAAHDRKALEKIFDESEKLTEYLEKRTRKVKKFHYTAHFLDFLRMEEYNDRLAFNELTLSVELDGKLEKYPEDLRLKFIDKFSVEIGKADFTDALGYFARERAYDPVKDYLLKCHKEVPLISLDNLAARYFGTTDPVYDRAFKALLVGLVKRRFEPGCQFDYMGILQGSQGCRKSTFLRILGAGFVGKGHHEMKGADPLMVWHRSWIHEIAEMDKWSKKQISEIKDFITTREDNFRIPWGRTPQDYERRFGLFGTVNKLSFLRDETGERRFWVFQCPKGWKIPTDQLEKEVEGIWAAAVQAYFEGASPMLSDTDEMVMTLANQKFKEEDTWLEAIAAYCGEYELDGKIYYTKGEVSIAELLNDCLKIPLQDHPKHKTQVANICEALGFEKLGVVRRGVNRLRLWATPQPSQETEDLSQALDLVTTSCQPCDSPEALSDKRYDNSTQNLVTTSCQPCDSLEALPDNDSTEVQQGTSEKITEKNNFSENSEKSDPPTKGNRASILRAIKAENERILAFKPTFDLKIALHYTFPGRKNVQQLTADDLWIFWESLIVIQPLP